MSDFEWDSAKDEVNRAKHGIGFELAQQAFLDPLRVIAEDLGHGGGEQRYFCFGRVEDAVMTVRFSGQAIGAREGRFMKKPTERYSKGEIGQVRIVEDFLPAPDQLVLREDNVKVTLSLSQRSVTFFKRAAQKRRVPYQRMIRALVDAYAEKQGGKG
jgi:uncharacterized DUF497 family protein/predicted DNA binding CopG/RHH family protein